MIDKEYGYYRITCDVCGSYVTGFDTFDDALDHKKSRGWKSKKINSEWQDQCKRCGGE